MIRTVLIIIVIINGTFSIGQSLDIRIQEALLLSKKGNYQRADQVLKEALKNTTNTQQELSIYKLLYENVHALEQRQSNLITSQMLAKKSITFEENEFRSIKGLLAEQAYLFHANNEGYSFDDRIYQGLYFALKEFNDPLTTTYHIYDSPGDIFIINTLNDNYFYTIHQNGSLLKWSSEGDKIDSSLFSSFWKMMTVKTVEVSKDKTSLFMAGTLKNKAFAEIIDMRDLSRKESLTQLGSSIIDASYWNNEEIFLLDNYGESISLYSNRINDEVITPAVKLRSIVVNNKGDILYGAGTDGSLYAYEISNNYRETSILSVESSIESILLSDNDSIIAVGDSRGLVYLNIEDSWSVLVGHKASIMQMAFSSDMQLFATASADKSIRIYNMNDLAKDPLVLTDNNSKITSLTFTADNRRLLAGTYNRSLKSWPIDITDMSGKICKYVERNMTPEEWKHYVGEKIAYQKTCNDINVNEIHE